MKKISLLIITILIIGMCLPTYAIVHSHVHVVPHTSHSSSHSGSSHSSTKVTGARTYTTPKSFTSKYNSSNIKTEKTNPNPKNYTSYSTTNMFKPNFWTALWAFQCMRNNSQEVTEQDIAKELEERGYSQEEIKEILQDGEKAKEAEAEQNKADAKAIIILISIIAVIFILGLVALWFWG